MTAKIIFLTLIALIGWSVALPLANDLQGTVSVTLSATENSVESTTKTDRQEAVVEEYDEEMSMCDDCEIDGEEVDVKQEEFSEVLDQVEVKEPGLATNAIVMISCVVIFGVIMAALLIFLLFKALIC